MPSKLSDVEAKDRAEKALDLWRNPKTRGKMDEAMSDLSPEDRTRVNLMIQRLGVGLPVKVKAEKEAKPKSEPPAKIEPAKKGKNKSSRDNFGPPD